MKMIHVLLLSLTIGVFAFGCGDSDDGDSNEDGPENTDNGGDTNQSGDEELAGSCVVEGLFCMNYMCVGQTTCDNLKLGGPDGCSIAGGVWADSACTETGAIGICREEESTGGIVTVYYEDGMLDAAAVEEMCLEGDGVFTTP